eukprot:m.89634 g.89634  ORF g.89634 m.89634 type:complete len:163 (+) comp20077_c0_seq1:110-598(+)
MMIDAEMTVVDGTCREGASAAAAGSSATAASEAGRMGEVVLSRTAFTLMQRYLATINDDPTNPRFRRIRLGNTQFKMIWREGAVKELLWAAGWRDDVEEGCVVRPWLSPFIPGNTAPTHTHVHTHSVSQTKTGVLGRTPLPPLSNLPLCRSPARLFSLHSHT